MTDTCAGTLNLDVGKNQRCTNKSPTMRRAYVYTALQPTYVNNSIRSIYVSSNRVIAYDILNHNIRDLPREKRTASQ